jgi:hypothetical protein
MFQGLPGGTGYLNQWKSLAIMFLGYLGLPLKTENLRNLNPGATLELPGLPGATSDNTNFWQSCPRGYQGLIVITWVQPRPRAILAIMFLVLLGAAWS